MAIGGAAALGALGAVGAGLLSTIGPAESLGDAQARLGLSLGENSAAFQSLSNDAAANANALGLSKTAYLDTAGGLSQLATSLGVSADAAGEMAGGFTELGPKLAAYAGVENDVAAGALEKALQGKTKGLAALGIAITDADVAAQAMRLGIQGEKKDWTEAQTAQVMYAAVMAKTGAAQEAWAGNSGDVEVSMQRLSAAMEDAQATIGQKLLPVIAPLVEKLASALPGAIDTAMSFIGPLFDFLGNNPAIGIAVAAFGVLGTAFGAIMAVAAPFLPVVSALMGGFGALAGVLGTVGSVVGTIAALFNPVGIAIAAVVAAVIGLKLAWDNNLGGIQEKVAGFVGFFTSLPETIGAVVENLIESFAALVFPDLDLGGLDISEQLQAIGEEITAKWEEFKTTISDAMASIGSNIVLGWTEFWTTITTKLQEIHDAVVQKWEEVKTAISEALELIWNTLKLKWDAFLREISDKLDAILGKVTDAWTAVKDKIQEAMDAVWSTIQSLWAQIKDNIETALGNIRQNVENIMGRVREIFDDVMGTVKRVVSEVMGHITTLWGDWMKFVQGVIDSFKKLISGDFAGAFDTMKRTVQDGIDNVIKFFAGMGDSIMRAIGDATTLLVNVGHDLWAGLVDGLKNSWHMVTDFLSNLLGDLVTLAKKILGIASPSRVMAREVGRPMAEGIGAGFKSAWKASVVPMINALLKDGGGITPPRLDPNEPGGWAGGLAPIGGWWEGKPPAQETRPVFPPQKPRWDIGTPPPGSRGRWDMSTPPMGGDMGNSWFGGTSRTRVKPMQTGKGGFVQASKSNFWHIWVQRNGIPEESSARKTADMLGIPLPQWLEDIYAPLAKENIKADGPLPGVATAAGTVAAALGGLAAAVGEVAAKFNELLPIVTNHGTVPGTGPGGGTIHLPGVGGGQPLLPPGGKIEPPPIIGDSFNVNADSVVVPSMTAYVTSNVSVAIMISDKVVDTIATIVDKRLAQRASVGVP